MKKMIAIITMTILMTASIVGCNNSTAGGGSTAGEGTTAGEETTVLGEITAISDNTLTLAVGTQEESSTESTDTSQNTPPEKPEGEPSGKPGEIPDGESGENRSKPSGGGMPSSLELTGEELVLNITDATTITKTAMDRPDGQGEASSQDIESSADDATEADTTQDSVDASDLTVGSIVSITYNTTTNEITAIEIQSGGMGGGNPQEEKSTEI